MVLMSKKTRCFNSHPHKEDDPPLPIRKTILRCFNSHPHKEDDRPFAKLSKPFAVSTHILTRRMTFEIYFFCMDICVSTHILTRRMT